MKRRSTRRSGMVYPGVMSHRDAPTEFRREIRLVRPRTEHHLHSYIRCVLGFMMPRIPLNAGHASPFDYLRHAFFEEPSHAASSPLTTARTDGTGSPRDCVVWANRGGGKTQIAAIATLLDLLFKPGIHIRILGGSFDQSSRMYRYLKRMLESDVFSDLIAGNLTGHHVELLNGSRVEVLAQSECAVRGQRVHRLRCDEVELFDRDIWEAAQLVTRSETCGPIHVRASIEAFSTMHEPHGLMQELIGDSRPREGGDPVCAVQSSDTLDSRSPSRVAFGDLRGNDGTLSTGGGARTLFRWNLIDTLEHCPEWRVCDTCPLWDECQGRAKLPHAQGFFSIEDAIAQKQRVSQVTWQSEMLCERPSRENLVFTEFDPTLHVIHLDPQREHIRSWLGGIDFGFRAPTVLLLAALDSDDVLHIVDELSHSGCLTEQFIQMAAERCAARGWPRPRWIGADPAGHQRSDQTGEGSITAWRRAGWIIRTRSSAIEHGIEAVRCRLKRADGSIHLRIHARCATLIDSLQKYHYPQHRPDVSQPVKDGPDHACDALRYLIVNLDHASHQAIVKQYV